MNARDFAFWLQGYSEIDGELPTKNKWATILDHIQEVQEIKDIQARRGQPKVEAPKTFAVTGSMNLNDKFGEHWGNIYRGAMSG
jgi:hypothetical protein